MTWIIAGDMLAEGLFTQDLSIIYEQYFEKLGVVIMRNAPVKEIISENGVAIGCRLYNDKIIESELFIVGIGSRPCTDLVVGQLKTIDCLHGKVIWADGHLETSIPGVYASGDCVALPFSMFGHSQLEHGLHARRSGEFVARTLMGKIGIYDYHPMIFSRPFGFDWKIEFY